MLKHHLNVVCDDVWNRLDSSKKFGITQGEETLTDNILLYLASQNLSDIKIIQTPKYKEAVMGTDWEWWIGNAQDGYLRYAVQAKKLDLKTGRYSSLNHKIGSGSTASYQHDVLEAYAKANKAIPLYAFYNHLEKKDYPKDWNCPLPIEHSKLGCTVTPLANVKKAISTRGCRTFQKIHDLPETVPLRCLAQCPRIICTSMDSSEHDIEKFGVKAKVYSNPWGWISEMGHLDSPEQMPSEFYNHDLGYYPKRILIIETGES
ncbi:hypothetical protein M3916_004616 [Vibrio parahaemolyticus]|uniref:DUF6615 family protein n=1 Tax=Vibrio cholerae TaxID=666 RepID=UPI00403DDC87|nr:hypothetical protein [Vibrio parahaemolyticus]